MGAEMQQGNSLNSQQKMKVDLHRYSESKIQQSWKLKLQQKMKIRERKVKRRENLQKKTRKGKIRKTRKVERVKEKGKVEMQRKTKESSSTRRILYRRSVKCKRRIRMCGRRAMNREISRRNMMWSLSRNRRGKKWRKRCEPKLMSL